MSQHQQNIFDELRQYASLTVVPGVTIGSLNYVSHSDMYSSGLITTADELVASDAKVSLFDKAIGEIGSGWTTATTESQGNFKFTGGKIGANQCYVATHAGFTISQVSASTPTTALIHNLFSHPDAVWAIANNFSWDLQQGRGIKRNIGPLLQWPAGSGIYGITGDSNASRDTDVPVSAGILPNYGAQNGAPDCGMRRLAEPIVFAPLVNTSIVVQCGNQFKLSSIDTTAKDYFIQITMVLKGFLFTMPVGNIGARR